MGFFSKDPRIKRLMEREPLKEALGVYTIARILDAGCAFPCYYDMMTLRFLYDGSHA
jgi:hypothetical protein